MYEEKCQMCQESGVVFSEQKGVDYCPCPIGWEKEFADIENALVTKFTTI